MLGLLVLLIKVGMVVAFIMLLRWALPRFRFDQLMGLAWKGLIPLGMLNLAGVAVVLTLDWPKHLLIVTALLPLAAAYYSSVKFNAAMARVSAGRDAIGRSKAVSYE
jgi:NADH-quinone oxidoreductase subunit H